MEPFSVAWNNFKQMRKSQMVHQVINLGLIITSALMIWKGLIVVTASESPVVVVLSESMAPSFLRGDILFLWLGNSTFDVGEVVVYKIEGRDIPIVHRVIKVFEDHPMSDVDLLTKGDNNEVDDRGLYAPGQKSLARRHVIGRAKGYLPAVGMVTIIMNDYPRLKYAMIGLLCIFVLAARE